MDPLSDVFKSIRLEGSIFFNSALSAPWDLKLNVSNCPRFHIVLEGKTWLHSDALVEPVCLQRGDAVLLSGGNAHRLADTPATTGEVAGTSDARCRLVCGIFGFDEELRHPLIDTLPEQVWLSVSDNQEPLWAMVDLMRRELDRQDAGATIVVDRLCELFLVHVLRAHAHTNPSMPGFMAALDDACTRKCLQLIHQRPQDRWTLDTLARAVGLSRSAFAKRFHDLVGVPPGSYLTTWRMHKARRLIKNPYARLAAVARQVGYSSDTAFIRAFKQFFGKSPGAIKAESNRRHNEGPS